MPESGVGSPPITIGDEDPVAVYPPVVEYTVYDVAGGDPAGSSKETDAAPSLYALLVPTSVATTLIGANGCKKSFCCCDLPPISFLAIYSPGI